MSADEVIVIPLDPAWTGRQDWPEPRWVYHGYHPPGHDYHHGPPRTITAEERRRRERMRYEVRRLLGPAGMRPCEDCWEPAAQYHHYLGYDDAHRHDVIPLCLLCHRFRHRKH